MKVGAVILALVGILMASSLAYADRYELIWIARCLEDNADARVPAGVVVRYCTCMTSKMDRNETRSVTEWEKAYPDERRDCDRQAGWR